MRKKREIFSDYALSLSPAVMSLPRSVHLSVAPSSQYACTFRSVSRSSPSVCALNGETGMKEGGRMRLMMRETGEGEMLLPLLVQHGPDDGQSRAEQEEAACVRGSSSSISQVSLSSLVPHLHDSLTRSLTYLSRVNICYFNHEHYIIFHTHEPCSVSYSLCSVTVFPGQSQAALP